MLCKKMLQKLQNFCNLVQVNMLVLKLLFMPYKIFVDVEMDAVLLTDAENAFDSTNHKVMLHNSKFICPIIATYIIRCYATPSRLFIADEGEILSSEGATQGDPTAMEVYAQGIKQIPI